jgi:tetratricopeptide (TPR) repeat protein
LLQLANPLAQIRTGPNQQSVSINPNLTIREALDGAAARLGGKFDKQPLVEASIRQTIGDIYRGMRIHSEATKQYLRMVELRAQALGKSHDDTLSAQITLAANLVSENRYADARAVLEDVLKEARSKASPNQLITSSAESGIVATYLSNGRHADAIDFLRKSVMPYHQRVHGEEAAPTLAAVSRVVGVYTAWQPPRYGEAESFLKEILQGSGPSRKLSGKLSLTATMLLAEVYSAQNRFKETVGLLDPVLKSEWVDEVAKGGLAALERHPYLPSMLGSLAAAYSRTGDASRAKALISDEMRVMDVVLKGSPGAESLATPLTAMAIQLGNSVDTGRQVEASELLPRVLEAYRQVAGQKDAASLRTRDLLFQIARLYATKDQPAQALRLYHQLVDISRAAYGDEDPETIRILPQLSTLYLNYDLLDTDYGEEDFGNAERSLKQVFEIQRRVMGSNNVQTWSTQWALSELYWQRARALRRLGKTDQARPYFEQAEKLTREQIAFLNTLPPIEGGLPGGTRNAVNQSRLVAIQGDLGQFAKVEEEVKRIQDRQRQTNGRVEGVWVQQAAIGWAQLKQGKYEQAEASLRPACAALAISQNGDALPHRYACEGQLGAALVGQRKYSEGETLLLSGYEGQVRTRNQRQEIFWSTFNRLTPEETAGWITRLYEESSKPEEATKWRLKTLPR